MDHRVLVQGSDAEITDKTMEFDLQILARFSLGIFHRAQKNRKMKMTFPNMQSLTSSILESDKNQMNAVAHSYVFFLMNANMDMQMLSI